MADIGQRFTDLLDTTATKQEVVDMFVELTNFIKQFKAETLTEAANLKTMLPLMVQNHIQTSIQNIQDQQTKLSAIINNTATTSQSEIRTITRMIGYEIQRIEGLIPDPTDLAPLQAKIDASIAALEAKLPDLPAEVSATAIRDKLESLKGDERLDKSAIRGLDDIEKRISNLSGGGGTIIATTRGQVKMYDLSDQLDGNTTTFSLPAFWRVIDVKLSSVPVLRLTTDYTVDGSTFQITFTSQIDAATDLAAGQSCVVIYAEA